jgi:predicted hydrocarbon binding protein
MATAPEPKRISMKGFALRGLLKSAKENGWDIKDLLSALPPGPRAAFDKAIVVSQWYPYEAFVGLVEALERRQGRGPRFKLSRDLGKQGARRDLGSTFRIITAMASIEFLLKRGQVFWAQYCDRGRMTLDSESRTGFAARLDDFPEIAPAHCALIEGWLEGMGEALGAEGMACRQTRCVHRGDDRCEFTAAWTRVRGLFA